MRPRVAAMSSRRCPSCGAVLGTSADCAHCRDHVRRRDDLEELAYAWLYGDESELPPAQLPKEWLCPDGTPAQAERAERTAGQQQRTPANQHPGATTPASGMDQQSPPARRTAWSSARRARAKATADRQPTGSAPSCAVARNAFATAGSRQQEAAYQQRQPSGSARPECPEPPSAAVALVSERPPRQPGIPTQRIRWLAYGLALGALIGTVLGAAWVQHRNDRQFTQLRHLLRTQAKWLQTETARRIALELQLASREDAASGR